MLATYTDEPLVGLPGTGELSPAVAAVVADDQPPPDRRGLVVFFTGLSGSGKSTLARALHDRLIEDGARTVTSLDGDVVRRNLSAGLGFSREDRETNIRRIGWVAAEIARHRGVAICSPIAPYDETRQQVRDYVDEAGGAFFLVHVATPLEECERRDKKGLYAKARRRRDPRVHRDLGALRGAGRCRRPGGHHRSQHRRRARRRPRRAGRAGAAGEPTHGRDTLEPLLIE